MADKDKDKPAVTLDDVLKSIASVADGVKGVSTRVGAMETRFATQKVANTPAVPTVDTSGGPDPVTDPEGFQKHVKGQIDAGVSAGLKTITDAQTNSASIGKLHARLIEAHPALAKSPGLVEQAAEAIVQRAVSKGLTAKDAMFANEDQFIEDVAAETNKRIEVFRKEAGVDAAPSENDDSDDPAFPPGGMGGIFGKPGKRADEDKDLPTMAEQMAKQSAELFAPKT